MPVRTECVSWRESPVRESNTNTQQREVERVGAIIELSRRTSLLGGVGAGFPSSSIPVKKEYKNKMQSHY